MPISGPVLRTPLIVAGLLSVLVAGHANAQDTDLAKQLSNPVASLISVPFQANYDSGYGAADGDKAFVNFQPVIPTQVGEDWNLISRTIVPLIDQDDVAGFSGRQSGIGDVTQSFFLSPKAPGPGGLIWGAGPVLVLPTASDDLLGGGRWGLGPTLVVLKQTGPWSVGALANHVWSVGQADGRRPISATFLQPFVSYTTASAWTFTVNTEASYDWKAEHASIPINVTVTKLLKVGDRPISLGLGARYWAEAPAGGPEGFGARASLTLLFPR